MIIIISITLKEKNGETFTLTTLQLALLFPISFRVVKLVLPISLSAEKGNFILLTLNFLICDFDLQN